MIEKIMIMNPVQVDTNGIFTALCAFGPPQAGL